MSPTDIIVIGIILLIIGASTAYIVKAKKSGNKCIGCPYSATCHSAGKCEGACSGCLPQDSADSAENE